MKLAYQESGSKGKDPGNIPIIGSVVLIFLMAVGLAYVNSATGKSSQNQTAAAQAQYLARQGIHERGLAYLRSLTQAELPNSKINLPSGEVAGVGTYRDVSIIPTFKSLGNGFGLRTPTYIVSATGVVRVRDDTGEWIEVVDSENEEFRPISFARFQHMTNYETTIFGEVIKFWSMDTLFGRVHSNDQIAIMQNPVFYGLVSTCAQDFLHGPGYNPYFAIPPQFNVPPVVFPDSLPNIRAYAVAHGMFFSGDNINQFRLVFEEAGSWEVYRWQIGAPYVDSLYRTGSGLNQVVFFFDAPVELKGRIRGTVTVGCSEDIRLIDNIMYWDSDTLTGEVDTTSHSMLGIISEANIIVANTPENGRDNRMMGGQDIIINAAMLALGESFTFEDQNDEWSLYRGPYPDERGYIYLWGSVVQYRRGYTHRASHGGTGYGKHYRIDTRFETISPPCWPIINNPDHQCLFDIVPPGEK